jgi:DNA-binding winged helix-turn-helix (wHTH) protein
VRIRGPESRAAVRLEIENERAWCGDRVLDLPPKPFAVLRHLVEHAERLVTKEQLMDAVWGDTAVSEAVLTSCIRDIRRALGDSSRAPRYVETVHRRGFRFIGRVGSAVVPATYPVPLAREASVVGRDRERTRLRERFAEARSGRRQLVFVTGEPGIGKTTLVETLVAELAAAPDGVRIGHGQCVEHYGAGEAYLPLLEALGRLTRDVDGAALVEALRRHAPSWLAQLPALLSDEELAAVRQRAGGTSRDRMMRELVEALDVVSHDVPLVLVLEDLHWSDSGTVDVLGMLARRREPALIVLSSRLSARARRHNVRSQTFGLVLPFATRKQPGGCEPFVVPRRLDCRRRLRPQDAARPARGGRGDETPVRRRRQDVRRRRTCRTAVAAARGSERVPRWAARGGRGF